MVKAVGNATGNKIKKSKKPKFSKFWKTIAEEPLYPMLNEMGYSEERINQFQKKRFRDAVFFAILLALSGLFLASWLYVLALVVPILIYKIKFRSVKDIYRVWKFKRHLQFTKFMRLLIPYLKQSNGKVALYTIFNKILQRTEDEQDRKSLTRLMSGMTNSPNDVKPFEEFAKRSSGTDRSILFMTTIFDFQQSSFDTSVIDELGQEASKELMLGIDEIIRYKLNRFNGFPTKVTYALLIFIGGFAIGVVGASLSELFGEGIIIMP